MPTGNYHLFMYKGHKGQSKTIRVRAWFILSLCCLFVILAGGNIWLWDYFVRARNLETRLVTAEKNLAERESNLTNMVAEMENLRSDLLRVQHFDSKLRVLLGEENFSDVSLATGSGSPRSFSSGGNLGTLPLHRQELASLKLRNFLKELSQEARLEEVTQQELLFALNRNSAILATTPSIWPVTGKMTSRFGTRSAPFGNGRQFHSGVDIAAMRGTPIFAPANGVVRMAGWDGAYGRSVEIDHGNGLVTKYGHMDKLLVKKGDKLERRMQIGTVGNTGRTTGPHLHYEVLLNGVQTNPIAYVLSE